MEEQSCSHTPPGANTPGPSPRESDAPLSYTQHTAETRTGVAVQLKVYKKNKWLGNHTEKCLAHHATLQQRIWRLEPIKEAYSDTISPAGFRLFALTVSKPQVILGLL